MTGNRSWFALALVHLDPVIGPVPSTPTVWRTLAETGEMALGRMNAAVVAFRRHWWSLLTERPGGFGTGSGSSRWAGRAPTRKSTPSNGSEERLV
jgi:hypothetical protein